MAINYEEQQFYLKAKKETDSWSKSLKKEYIDIVLKELKRVIPIIYNSYKKRLEQIVLIPEDPTKKSIKFFIKTKFKFNVFHNSSKDQYFIKYEIYPISRKAIDDLILRASWGGSVSLKKDILQRVSLLIKEDITNNKYYTNPSNVDIELKNRIISVMQL